MLVCMAKSVQRHPRVKPARRVRLDAGKGLEAVGMAAPTGSQQLGHLVAFVHVKPEFVKICCAVPALLVHRPIAEGREQVGRLVAPVKVRKLRNAPEAGQVSRVPRSLDIRKLELFGRRSAANEASHREPSPARCVLPCKIQCRHRALRSSACLLVLTTWTVNSLATSDMNSGWDPSNRGTSPAFRQALDPIERPACEVGSALDTVNGVRSAL